MEAVAFVILAATQRVNVTQAFNNSSGCGALTKGIPDRLRFAAVLAGTLVVDLQPTAVVPMAAGVSRLETQVNGDVVLVGGLLFCSWAPLLGFSPQTRLRKHNQPDDSTQSLAAPGPNADPLGRGMECGFSSAHVTGRAVRT
jgi:hypothetical protein